MVKMIVLRPGGSKISLKITQATIMVEVSCRDDRWSGKVERMNIMRVPNEAIKGGLCVVDHS